MDVRAEPATPSIRRALRKSETKVAIVHTIRANARTVRTATSRAGRGSSNLLLADAHDNTAEVLAPNNVASRTLPAAYATKLASAQIVADTANN